MSLFEDAGLAAIADGSTGALPPANAREVYKVVRLLRAARSLDDVTIFRPVEPTGRGRFIVPTSGKWAISFNFTQGVGPSEMRLEKLSKSWRKKPSKSRSRKRLARS